MPAKKAAKKTAKKATKTISSPAAEAAAPVAKKAPAKKAARKTAAKKTAKKGPTTYEIAKAAYLNYRRRVENNQPGCHESDWLEAERKLETAE